MGDKELKGGRRGVPFRFDERCAYLQDEVKQQFSAPRNRGVAIIDDKLCTPLFYWYHEHGSKSRNSRETELHNNDTVGLSIPNNDEHTKIDCIMCSLHTGVYESPT